MASSPSSPDFPGGDGQVGELPGDGWLEPLEGDDFSTTDQDRLDEDFNNTHAGEGEDAEEQTLYETAPDESDAGLDFEEPMAEEEEGKVPTAAAVRRWDHIRTAKHLRQIGVEPEHCDIFEQQEITGEDLLEMDQESIFSHKFDFGLMGKRLKTSRKILHFQEDVQGGNLSAQTVPREEAAEATQLADEDPLQSRTFKHPFTWREGMTDNLQIQETKDIKPVALLEDLEPKWVDQDPAYLDSMLAVDQSKDEAGTILSTHDQANFRLKLSKNEPGGVERATSSMCADYFDKFNEHRKLNRYRAR
jgi:SAM domain (Sterile alpha motif)